MFLSRETDIKLCQNYTKIHTYTNLYKSSRYKQIIFSKYATNLKMIESQGYNFSFNFAFLIEIIDNIISYSSYSPYYVTRAAANGSADTDHVIQTEIV